MFFFMVLGIYSFTYKAALHILGRGPPQRDLHIWGILVTKMMRNPGLEIQTPDLAYSKVTKKLVYLRVGGGGGVSRLVHLTFR